VVISQKTICHVAIYQRTVIFIITAARTSNLASLKQI
jgi:hypothetical protein